MPEWVQRDIPEILNEAGLTLKIEAHGVVGHHAPCVPHCTVCYPCARCGLVHALGLHSEEGKV